MKPIITCIVLLHLCFTHAQSQHPLDFFPHHLGDIWEYWLEAGPGSYIIKQNEITKDSLGVDGRFYIETTWFGKFVLDTTTFEVYKSYGTLDKLYKLDADSGDAWIVWEDSAGQNQYLAVVSDVYPAILFDQPVIVKQVDYYGYTVGAPESLWMYTDYLASNLGLIQGDAELSAPYFFIRGAIIDSVLYGTVTSIKKAEKWGLPNNFALHQNYPNPFNPATNIEYDLLVAAKVELTVYELLGREVRTLVNSHQPAGTYQVEFDGRELSSGVYLYRLKINNEAVLTRKMALLK